MNTLTLLAQATGDEPAGGAAAGEAIGATAGALVVTVAIGLLIAGHRSGRINWLARVAGAAERATAMPVWAALPSMLLGVSLLTAVVGMYWDISLHIDNGRDAGPLANPAHYLILVGLYGTLLAGVMTMALAKTRPGSTSVRVGNGLWLPVGGLLITACGAFALTGLPARRPLAPALRPGRDALGPDPPDADRRRLAGHARRHGADRRGGVLAGPRPRARGAQAALRPAPGAARGRLPRGALHLPGRVRLRRAAVPDGPAPDPDHARRQHRPGRRAHLPRPRRRAAGRAGLRGHPRLPGRDGRRRVGADHAPLPALPRGSPDRRGRVPALARGARPWRPAPSPES